MFDFLKFFLSEKKSAKTGDLELEIRNALERLAFSGEPPLERAGRLSEIVLKDANAYFAIELKEADPRAGEQIRATAQALVEAIPGVEKAFVTLTADAPKEPRTPPSLAGGSDALSKKRASAFKAAVAASGAPVKAAEPVYGHSAIKKIIAVASGKGGVGKSTTAANLALGLAAEGQKVGVLDMDMFGPSMPRLFGLSGRPEKGDGRMMKPMQAYGVSVMSMGFLVDEDVPVIWRGAMVASAVRQLLQEVEWGDLDILVIDMPPGTGDTQLSLAQNVSLAGAVIVSTPQDLALIDARRGLAMFHKVDVPVLGIVENMSYFLCPSCGERAEIFGHGGARDEAVRLGVPFLGEVPLHAEIRTLSDAGKPVVATQQDSPHAHIYKDIARQTLANLEAVAKPAPEIIL